MKALKEILTALGVGLGVLFLVAALAGPFLPGEYVGLIPWSPLLVVGLVGMERLIRFWLKRKKEPQAS